MQNLTFEEKFLNYLRASYPLLYVRTHEESRVTRCIINAVQDTKVPVNIYSWDAKRLLEKHSRKEGAAAGGTWEKLQGTDHTVTNIVDSLSKISGTTGRNVFILKDFHPYIKAPGQVRPIRNAIEGLKCKGNMIIFVSP